MLFPRRGSLGARLLPVKRGRDDGAVRETEYGIEGLKSNILGPAPELSTISAVLSLTQHVISLE
jgi:hypothetical protein